MTSADNITLKTFLQTIFPRDMLFEDELPCIAHPASFISNETGQDVHYYRQIHPGRTVGHIRPGSNAWYYCVSTVRRQRTRQIRKRLDDVRHAMVLVCDDIGTKSAVPPVAPSYILETSKGNYQYGYMIDPLDVSGPTGQLMFDACLYSLAEAGYNDPGCRSASRLVRLPGSLHNTGFIATLADWAPHRTWELGALMSRMGVEVKTPRAARALKPGKYTQLEEVDDWIYDWLVATGRVLGHGDAWVYIECPWRDSHTDGAQGATSTAYSPLDYGRAGRGFKCLHGHCAQQTLPDFMTWARWEKYRANS